MKNHNLWISPEGKITNIYDNYDENNCHNDWAIDYIEDRLNSGWDKKYKVSYAYQLLEKIGWRRVSHSIGGTPEIPYLRLNQLQEEKIEKYELENNIIIIREA